MNVNNLSQNHQTPSFGALRTEKMSKYCKTVIREKILPNINDKLIDDLDDMGYDIVFKRGNGIEGKEIDIFLFDRERNFAHSVNSINFDKNLESLWQKKLKKLSKNILKSFIKMNNKN